VHPTVRALFEATDEPGDEAIWRALANFVYNRAAQMTFDVRDLDEVQVWEVKQRGADRLTVLGRMSYNSGDAKHFWLDVMRDPAPGITAKWVLYCQLDERTRAGKEAARNPSSIERPEDHDWRVVISNDEVAQDAEAK